MQGAPVDRNGRLNIANLAVSLLTLIAFGLAGWSLHRSVEHGEILSGVTESRCTTQDCARLGREIGVVREIIAGMPTEVPPPEVTHRLTKLEYAVNDVHDDMQELTILIREHIAGRVD